MLTIRPSRKADCHFLAPHLRAEDVAEVLASTGQTPLEALLEGYRNSKECHSVVVNDVVIALYGVVPVKGKTRTGIIWLLGSDGITKNAQAFLRQSRKVLNDLHERWDTLGNAVDERNRTHVRWIAWTGFQFTARHESYGVAGVPFLEFISQRNCEVTSCVDQQHSPFSLSQ